MLLHTLAWLLSLLLLLTAVQALSTPRLPANLVHSLDLAPIFEDVASHCLTHRGYRAWMGLVLEDNTMSRSIMDHRPAARQRRAAGMTLPRRDSLVGLATTVDQARYLYRLTQQAQSALDNGSLLCPPMTHREVGEHWETASSHNNNMIESTDHDEWLDFGTAEDWTLMHVLQAEKVMERLLDVYRWACDPVVVDQMPALAQLARSWTQDDNSHNQTAAVERAWRDVRGSVRFQKVRSLTGQASYAFQLDRSRYPVLGLLDEQLSANDCADDRNDKQNDNLRDEIAARERDIQQGLVRTIARQRDAINDGLDALAQLDVVFAKAAYGRARGGQIPTTMGQEGCVAIDQFVHPLLLLSSSNKAKSKATKQPPPVPIDLWLNHHHPNPQDDDPHACRPALVISGPNGGGKTLALKSFGVAAILAKAGIPIPTGPQNTNAKNLRIDFFDDIWVSVGDGQDASTGQSTFTAQLGQFSRWMEQLDHGDSTTVNASKSTTVAKLVLLDELGSGTDAAAGGALAQAVLEDFLLHPQVRIVATTHSLRLKTMAWRDDKVESAAVLLRNSDHDNDVAFRLQYGVLGESHALQARCQPPLPARVLERAQSLLLSSGGSSSSSSQQQQQEQQQYARARQESLHKQLRLAEQATEQAQHHQTEMDNLLRSLRALAQSYDTHFQRLEGRLEACYQQLSSHDPCELVGDTLSQLKVVRRQVQTQQEQLRSRGLRPLDYVPQEGDTVVIVEPGELDGSTGTVVAGDDDNMILVALGHGDASTWMPLPMPRHHLAVWDSVASMEDDGRSVGTSIPNARKRLEELLKSSPVRSKPSSSIDDKAKFSSSRERKAAKRKKKSKK